MSYVRHSVHLTEGQLSKLRSAAKNKEAVSIQINPQQQANHHLYLTRSQIARLKKGPSRITLSKSQLVRNGGFVVTIPMITAALAGLASVAGTASTVATAVNKKKALDKQLKQEAEHHRRLEAIKAKTGSGCGKKRGKKRGKKGKGVPKRGRGAAKKGRGVYLPKRRY